MLRGNYKMSYRERISDKLLKGMPRPKLRGIFYDGKFYSMTTSLHKTKQARKWNTLWRLVNPRKTND